MNEAIYHEHFDKLLKRFYSLLIEFATNILLNKCLCKVKTDTDLSCRNL